MTVGNLLGAEPVQCFPGCHPQGRNRRTRGQDSPARCRKDTRIRGPKSGTEIGRGSALGTESRGQDGTTDRTKVNVEVLQRRTNGGTHHQANRTQGPVIAPVLRGSLGHNAPGNGISAANMLDVNASTNTPLPYWAARSNAGRSDSKPRYGLKVTESAAKDDPSRSQASA